VQLSDPYIRTALAKNKLFPTLSSQPSILIAIPAVLLRSIVPAKVYAELSAALKANFVCVPTQHLSVKGLSQTYV
jgi:hypothetical protein